MPNYSDQQLGEFKAAFGWNGLATNAMALRLIDDLEEAREQRRVLREASTTAFVALKHAEYIIKIRIGDWDKEIDTHDEHRDICPRCILEKALAATEETSA